MKSFLSREVPEELRPAKGILNGIILGLLAWALIIAAIIYL